MLRITYIVQEENTMKKRNLAVVMSAMMLCGSAASVVGAANESAVVQDSSDDKQVSEDGQQVQADKPQFGKNGHMMPSERPSMPQGSTAGSRPVPPALPSDAQRNTENGMTPPALPSDAQGNTENGITPPALPSGEQGSQDNGRRMPEQNGQMQAPDGQMQAPDGQMQAPDGRMPEQNGQMQAPNSRVPEQNGQMTAPNGQIPGGQGGPGGSSAPSSYDTANNVTEDTDGSAFTSTAADQNAVLVDGKTVTISNASVEKNGDSSGESADFYGINAAILANNQANVTISNVTVNTDGTHANGVFSYGTGTTVDISDSTITTTGNNSGGLMTTGGAAMNATNLTVNTSGNSSAAIRSDRGGGTVTVSQGSYSAEGVGSPAIYSTADISVSDAVLSAANSEAVVIEGGNSVALNNVDITGNNATLNGQSTVKTNVLIYQSMSGDAAEGNSSFSMSGGSMTGGTGAMFHVTNVTTEISLSDVDFTYAQDSSDFMILSQDSWGKQGSNGGNATVIMSSQSAKGNIIVDEASSLKLSMTDGSDYTGAINAAASDGKVSVNLEEGSIWTLTGDSYITSFEGDLSSINFNGFTLYINGTAVNG